MSVFLVDERRSPLRKRERRGGCEREGYVREREGARELGSGRKNRVRVSRVARVRGGESGGGGEEEVGVADEERWCNSRIRLRLHDRRRRDRHGEDEGEGGGDEGEHLGYLTFDDG